jgi:hypothetical protein
LDKLADKLNFKKSLLSILVATLGFSYSFGSYKSQEQSGQLRK